MKKVMVGMSGGVDSSVAAAILLKEGYDVCGVTMKLAPNDSYGAAEDAKKVAQQLGINHETISFEKEFKKFVIDYFVREYISGRTPNPCVMCNPTIKFGLMLDYALSRGCDYIATGHYAKIIYDEGIKRWLLKKSDTAKDQSYFLYRLTQNQLSHAIFPIGNYEKSYVREIAKKYDLPVASKSDSQDICFIKDCSHYEFIENYTDKKAPEGNFISQSGDILGRHKGITRYTIGQRKGLGISLGKMAYVKKIDAKSNEIVLSGRHSGGSKRIIATLVNSVLFDIIPENICAFAKIRFRSALSPCTVIKSDKNSFTVDFDEPVFFAAPGQSLVLYTEDGFVIGGGIIE